jgi:hypothetical protein
LVLPKIESGTITHGQLRMTFPIDGVKVHRSPR